MEKKTMFGFECEVITEIKEKTLYSSGWIGKNKVYISEEDGRIISFEVSNPDIAIRIESKITNTTHVSIHEFGDTQIDLWLEGNRVLELLAELQGGPGKAVNTNHPELRFSAFADFIKQVFEQNLKALTTSDNWKW